MHLIGTGPDLLGYSCPTTDGGGALFPSLSGFTTQGQLQSLASPLTVECWFWPTGLDTANDFIVAWDGNAANYVGLLFLTTGKFAFNVNTASLTGATVVNTQQWHHVVGTWDNTTARLYVDGVQDASQAVAGPHTYGLQLGIGHRPGSTVNSCQGAMSDVAVYSTALSSGRVSAHYAAADQKTATPTYLYPLGPAAVTPITGGTLPADLTTVLNSVRKTY